MKEEYKKPDCIVITFQPEHGILNLSDPDIDPLYNNPYEGNEDW